MTKEKIIKAIWNEFPNLTINEAQKIYETTMDLIKERLSKGENVELTGFGSFKIRGKNQRMGRNPKTGVEAVIKLRRVVTFKPAKIFRDRVDKGDDNK